uniref:Uncharacterized protein n=1 Tax=Spongospora subterranea TaxID=70186 RepID=A0A0H5QVI8_9EUKA|eukprot:CRZ05757.1 hypothetical protein [Spongospora subterranea]
MTASGRKKPPTPNGVFNPGLPDALSILGVIRPSNPTKRDPIAGNRVPVQTVIDLFSIIPSKVDISNALEAKLRLPSLETDRRRRVELDPSLRSRCSIRTCLRVQGKIVVHRNAIETAPLLKENACSP